MPANTTLDKDWYELKAWADEMFKDTELIGGVICDTKTHKPSDKFDGWGK